MNIQIINFGDILMSRPAGKDAFLLLESYLLNTLKNDEEIILDFSDVKVLTPGWADELISGIKRNHNNKLSFINTDNPSVKASLKTVLEPIDVSKYKRD